MGDRCAARDDQSQGRFRLRDTHQRSAGTRVVRDNVLFCDAAAVENKSRVGQEASQREKVERCESLQCGRSRALDRTFSAGWAVAGSADRKAPVGSTTTG